MKLRPETRLRLRKGVLCFFCFALFCASLFCAPYIACAIPPELGQALSGSVPEPPILPLRADTVFSAAKPMYPVYEESFAPESEEPCESEPEESTPEPPPDDAIEVFARDLSRQDTPDKPVLLINDETNYRVDPNDFLERTLSLSLPEGDAPAVLILHTHGTESYLPAGTPYYRAGEDFRSEDPSRTVVAVGEVIARVLTERGVSVIHDTTMYDKEDYNTSYVSASRAVRRWLAEYPSIALVLDIHRDSIFDGDGNCVKPLSEPDGTPTAQVMLVVGSDADGSNLYYWRRNMTLASHLQKELNDRSPTLARPINLRTWAFNQNLCSGSLLVEIGSCGNTIDEALEAGKRFAEAYAALLETLS